jgi:hypothetical protein
MLLCFHTIRETDIHSNNNNDDDDDSNNNNNNNLFKVNIILKRMYDIPALYSKCY